MKYKGIVERDMRRCECGELPVLKLSEYETYEGEMSGRFTFHFECPKCGVRTLRADRVLEAVNDWEEGMCGVAWFGVNKDEEDRCVISIRK